MKIISKKHELGALPENELVSTRLINQCALSERGARTVPQVSEDQLTHLSSRKVRRSTLGIHPRRIVGTTTDERIRWLPPLQKLHSSVNVPVGIDISYVIPAGDAYATTFPRKSRYS